MPRYPYVCRADAGGCGARFDVVKPMSACERRETCARCGRPDVERRFEPDDCPQIGGDVLASADAVRDLRAMIGGRIHRLSPAKRELLQAGHVTRKDIERTYRATGLRPADQETVARAVEHVPTAVKEAEKATKYLASRGIRSPLRFQAGIGKRPKELSPRNAIRGR